MTFSWTRTLRYTKKDTIKTLKALKKLKTNTNKGFFRRMEEIK